MACITQAVPHLSAAEILEKICTSENFRRQQKWWIVYNTLIDPRTAAEIATHTGTTQRLVHHVISDYNRNGAAAIETPGKGGQRSSYLSNTEEQAFEQRVGQTVHKTRYTKQQSIGCCSGTIGAN